MNKVLLVFLLLSFTACGDKGSKKKIIQEGFKASDGITGKAAEPGLFGDRKVGDVDLKSLLGLWESPKITTEDHLHQNIVRFRFHKDKLTLSKMCMFSTGVVSFATYSLKGNFSKGIFRLRESGFYRENTSLDGQNYACVIGLEKMYYFSESSIEDGYLGKGKAGELKKISN